MKKITYSIFSAILLVFAIIFTLQNNNTVSLRLLSKEFDTSLAIIIFVTFTLGILTGILFLLPKIIRLKLRLKKSEKKLNAFIKDETDGVIGNRDKL